MTQSIEALLGYEGYRRLRRILTTYPMGMDHEGTRTPDDHILVAQEGDAVYVAADPCIWRFSRLDDIHTDASVLTVPLILGLHDGNAWTADARQPSKQVVGNPVLTVWNDAVNTAVHDAHDTEIIQRLHHPYVRFYGRMFDLNGSALVVDDEFIWPFAASEYPVRFMGSTPTAGVVAYVNDIPVAVIMPCKPIENDSDVELWQRFTSVLSHLHGSQAVS